MSRPRVLVAGTADAIDALAKALHGDADIVAADSLKEAIAKLEGAGPFDTIACNVRFDESRMFEFLQAVMQHPGSTRVRIVAFRDERRALTRSTSAAITNALEALGVERFVDLARMRADYDDAVAMETLRKVVLDQDWGK